MRLQNKLFVSLIGSSAVLVILMLLMMRWSVARGMLDYVNVREQARFQAVTETLGDLYSRSGDWSALRADPGEFQRLLRQQSPPRRPPPPPHRAKPAPPKGDRFQPQVLDRDGRPLRHHVALPKGVRKIPIVVEGETVGWLALAPHKRLTEGYELRFVEQQMEALAIIGLVVIALAAGFSYLLSRHLLRPIKALAAATSAMTQGDYTPELNSSRRDELGELARDFNELALSLAQSDSARKRWFADVSHELRTPLAVLYAQIEAMQDGIRPLSQDGIRSLRQEVLHLNKLVDDLNTLSNAELGALQYHKQNLNLGELVLAQAELHRSALHEAGLELVLDIDKQRTEVWGDRTRLCQLLDNLLMNSCKYTEAGGAVHVVLSRSGQQRLLIVEDSAPGVPGEALNTLFDHLYRVDPSRNRETGGSGLGLAICQRIVEAHGGKIEATNSPLGGLALTVSLPTEA